MRADFTGDEFCYLQYTDFLKTATPLTIESLILDLAHDKFLMLQHTNLGSAMYSRSSG